MPRTPRTPRLVLVVMLGVAASTSPASAVKRASLSPLVHRAIDRGRAPANERHRVVVGLALRDREALEAFLADVNDPASPRYRQYLSQDEFNARYAPAADEEEAVVAHLRRSGLDVTDRFSNRLVVGAAGSVDALERAFGVRMHRLEYRGRRHFAALDEPALPVEIAASVVGVVGLDDLVERRPHLRDVVPAASLARGFVAFAPSDLTAFYDNTSGWDGAGQTIVIAGAYAWEDDDNAGFSAQWGLPALPEGSRQVCTGSPRADGCAVDNDNSIEIALDAEYAHATAPGARIVNYMAASTALSDFSVMYNRIVTDNPGHVVSTSWGSCEADLPPAVQTVSDAIFANANAIGQAWLAASGDSGSVDCPSVVGVDNPANSPHVIGVGGTTPTCSAGLTTATPACAGYGTEAGWSGSGGGVSRVFARPLFQTGCGVPAGTTRLVPDVALEASRPPGNYVLQGGSWFAVGGTSGAAPQWAGYLAQIAQKAGGTGLGNPGALLYGLCGTAAFHDVTSGSNGTYAAGPGYDMVTGLGTPLASALLSLAVPSTNTTTTLSGGTAPTTSPPTTTTSTMPPACPSDGFAGLGCVLAPGLDRPECANAAIPRALRVRFARVVRLLDRAEATRRPTRARRLARQIDRSLTAARTLVARSAGLGSLRTDCFVALRAMLDDGRTRAQRLADTL